MCELSLPETFVPGFHDEYEIRRMPYYPLGSTDINVSKLSLGTGGFSYLYGDYDIEECKNTVHEAIRKGVNFIDTAPWYGHGESEKILGLCLEGIPRQAYYLATKCCRYEKDPKYMFDFSAQKTRKSIDDSLNRLNLYYVDILQCHDIEFAPNLDIVINETLPTLQEICNSGKASHIGITGYPLSVLKECVEKSKIPIDTILTYCRSSMIDNTLDSYTQFFKSKNMGIIQAAVHSMGLLTNDGPPAWHPAGDNIKQVCSEAREYCKSKDVELGKLALYHTLQHEQAGDTILIGIKTRTLLKYNLDVLYNGLTPQEEEVYQEVKKILQKLPPQSQWENVELEQYRAKLLKST